MNMFDAFKIMNEKDAKEGTGKLGACPDFIGARTVKGGGKVEMGVPAEVLKKLWDGEVMPLLLIIDKKDYQELMKS